MISFKQFNEEKINFNKRADKPAWQVRGDDEAHTFKHEKKHVFIKNAAPHVDHEAHEAGKTVYAYMQGDVTDDRPSEETHTKRAIKFKPNDTEHPFVHADDQSPVHKADFVEFNGAQVHAHYKK